MDCADEERIEKRKIVMKVNKCFISFYYECTLNLDRHRMIVKFPPQIYNYLTKRIAEFQAPRYLFLGVRRWCWCRDGVFRSGVGRDKKTGGRSAKVESSFRARKSVQGLYGEVRRGRLAARSRCPIRPGMTVFLLVVFRGKCYICTGNGRRIGR